MKNLIERLEKAVGPDRELDVRIHLAQFPDFGAKMNDEYVRFENVWNRNRADHQNHADNVADWWGVPRYTGSLDAAMTLVPDDKAIDVHLGPGRRVCDATVTEPVYSVDSEGRRVTSWRQYKAPAVRDGTMHWQTGPLAICIASLKARLHSRSVEEPKDG